MTKDNAYNSLAPGRIIWSQCLWFNVPTTLLFKVISNKWSLGIHEKFILTSYARHTNAFNNFSVCCKVDSGA